METSMVSTLLKGGRALFLHSPIYHQRLTRGHYSRSSIAWQIAKLARTFALNCFVIFINFFPVTSAKVCHSSPDEKALKREEDWRAKGPLLACHEVADSLPLCRTFMSKIKRETLTRIKENESQVF